MATRTDLVDRLAVVFKERGYEGATLNQLAEATGLGKASLYHHFPGGKAEMATVLLRAAVANLERLAFARLGSSLPPGVRLQQFLDGFSAYVEHGASPCLVAVFAGGSARSEHGTLIAQQFRDWSSALAKTFEAAGHKPRRAERAANELLERLYGALALARVYDDPQYFRRGLKRVRKNLPR